MTAGTTIGNYTVAERIGQGGMGIVYRGHHTSLPRDVAIKSIKPHTGNDLRRLKSRFEKEAYIQSQLDDPGIVKIYDYIVDEQTYYIIMEYVEGRSLADLCSSSECPLPIGRALSIFEAILKSVAYAHEFTYVDRDGSTHRGLIHCDLKSANVLITSDDRIKITDFGIVRLVGADSTDTFGTAYGSPEYVSPEQAEGVDVSQRSDIYSLGIILYEMLTGAPPFGGSNGQVSRTEILHAHMERRPRTPSEVNSEITPELDNIILRALRKNPSERFENVADFLRAVGEIRPPESSFKGNPKVGNKPVGAETTRVIKGNDLSSGTNRLSYVTQPIGPRPCPSCGGELSGLLDHCPVCHFDLIASPATAKLALGEEAFRRIRSRRGWIAAGIVLLGLTGLLVLLIDRDTRSPLPTDTGAVASEPEKTEPEPALSSPAGLVELQAARVSVDSSFDGYNAVPLTDGITDVRKIAAMKYNKGNWVSAETPVEHWIEVDLGRATRVGAVYVYWGFDHGRFMPAKRVELQLPDESGSWESARTISIVEPGKDYDRTAFEFEPVSTSRLRILQPMQAGPKGRPFAMWVREVKVFGALNSPGP